MKKSPSRAEDREENNLLAGDGEGREGGRSQGLALVQNEDKWAVSSGEYILSLPHLPLHQGPHTGLPGTSGAFVLVPSALPLPWRWGHKSCLLLLHRGAVIYACPAGIVNFFLMSKSVTVKEGGVSLAPFGVAAAVRPARDASHVPWPGRGTHAVPPGSAEHSWDLARMVPKA